MHPKRTIQTYAHTKGESEERKGGKKRGEGDWAQGKRQACETTEHRVEKLSPTTNAFLKYASWFFLFSM